MRRPSDPQIDVFSQAVIDGNSYRVSKRHTLSDGEQLIAFFDPVASGGTIHIETPAITTPANCDIDVWENPTPNATTDDFFVHAMRYDVTPETPEATITRVNDGMLDTSTGDQTEQTRVNGSEQYNSPGDGAQRGIWRTIPVGETIAFIITDQSNGSGNIYGFDTVVYEGDTLPN